MDLTISNKIITGNAHTTLEHTDKLQCLWTSQDYLLETAIKGFPVVVVDSRCGKPKHTASTPDGNSLSRPWNVPLRHLFVGRFNGLCAHASSGYLYITQHLVTQSTWPIQLPAPLEGNSAGKYGQYCVNITNADQRTRGLSIDCRALQPDCYLIRISKIKMT